MVCPKPFYSEKLDGRWIHAFSDNIAHNLVVKMQFKQECNKMLTFTSTQQCDGYL